MSEQATVRPIESLIPYARNSRTHSAAQVSQIAASIVEFGFVGAIVVREGVIAKGHGTTMIAAEKNGRHSRLMARIYRAESRQRTNRVDF